jgi:uncharacterized phiE125 gp8 family phage protein
MTTLRLVTPPTALAVSLDEAKAHLRVESLSDNALITAMIEAATAGLGYLNRTICPADWALDLSEFSDEILLPRPPLVSVASITYRDDADTEQTVSASVYTVVKDSLGVGIVRLAWGQSWPGARSGGEPITISFSAGYAQVPPAIKAAILLRVGRLYELRDASSLSPRKRAETVDGIGRDEWVVSNPTAVGVEAVTEAERHLLAPYQVWTP